jgi:NitT/TauT family transport system substrate-binding protein
MLGANRSFARKYPVATKRALRAVLKAADICAQHPVRAVRYMVDKGYEPRCEVAHEVLTKVSYKVWRDVNPEDTLRFYALRLHEVGMIKTNPNKLIAEGTDWRFLKELKGELRA